MPSWKKLIISGSDAAIPSVSNTGDFTIDASGDIVLDADGADIVLKDGGTHFGSIKRVTSDLVIKSETSDKDILLKGNDGGATITALQLDMSEVGQVKLPNDNQRLSLGAGDDLDFIHDGSNSIIGNATGDLTIKNFAQDKDIILMSDDGSGGETAYITLDGSATLVNFSKATRHLDSVWAYFGTGLDFKVGHDGSNAYIINDTTGDLYIQNDLADRDVILRSDDGSGGTTAYLTLDGSVTQNILNVDTALSATKKLFFDGGGNTYIYEDTADRLRFFTGGAEFMRFTEDTSDQIDLYHNTFVTGDMSATGDVVAYYSSDKRLKDNIVRIENPLEKVGKIGGYTFDWNDKQETYTGKDVGVIAQEIQEVLPELVTERDNGYLAVKYEKIVPLLIESIKELKQEIDDIKQKCDCLNK